MKRTVDSYYYSTALFSALPNGSTREENNTRNTPAAWFKKRQPVRFKTLPVIQNPD
ncbi:MAG TPA: hypothetical protein VK645_10715 [Chitinophagaceae bacterium]|nr:hypothetical protein [Chitinophagaceae bacterium]